MTAKNWMLAGLAAALAAVYVVYFTDWFRPKTMQIYHTVRLVPARKHLKNQPVQRELQLLFGLNRKLALTEVKVVAAAALATNNHPLPLWHVVSDSNSVPLNSIFYGLSPRGMRPYLPCMKPQPLESNISYRIFIEAGDVHGQHDFELK